MSYTRFGSSGNVRPAEVTSANGKRSYFSMGPGAVSKQNVALTQKRRPDDFPCAPGKVSNLIGVWSTRENAPESIMTSEAPKLRYLAPSFVKKRCEQLSGAIDFEKLKAKHKASYNVSPTTEVVSEPRSTQKATRDTSQASTNVSVVRYVIPSVSTTVPTEYANEAGRKGSGSESEPENRLRKPETRIPSSRDLVFSPSPPSSNFETSSGASLGPVQPPANELWLDFDKIDEKLMDFAKSETPSGAGQSFPQPKRIRLPTVFPDVMAPISDRKSSVIREQLRSYSRSGSGSGGQQSSADRSSSHSKPNSSGSSSGTHSGGSYVHSAAQYAQRKLRKQQKESFKLIEELERMTNYKMHRADFPFKNWHSGLATPSGQFDVRGPARPRAKPSLVVGPTEGLKRGSQADSDLAKRQIRVPRRLLGDFEWRRDAKKN